MQIDADFECGNIILDNLTDTEAHLAIRQDSQAKYYQWFYFRVTAAPGTTRTFKIANAGASSYPNAWIGYRALASYNGKTWFRVHTQYDGTNLLIKHSATQSSTSYAFFVPYTEAMRQQLLKDAAASPLVSQRVLTKTPQGRSVDLVIVGDERRAAKKLWIIARQHAGEPMAEYCAEGMLRYLLSGKNAAAKKLLDKATVYLVPNMNPDGSALGNLRANANGVDLNRAWENPLDNAPEVVATRKAIEAAGVDFFFDLHGDEERPFIWLVGPHQDHLSPELQAQQDRFEQAIRARFIQYGPTPTQMANANPQSGMSVDYITPHFKCPGWIVELPFKDILGANGEPDTLLADGCREFGVASLEILAEMV